MLVLYSSRGPVCESSKLTVLCVYNGLACTCLHHDWQTMYNVVLCIAEASNVCSLSLYYIVRLYQANCSHWAHTHTHTHTHTHMAFYKDTEQESYV